MFSCLELIVSRQFADDIFIQLIWAMPSIVVKKDFKAHGRILYAFEEYLAAGELENVCATVNLQWKNETDKSIL